MQFQLATKGPVWLREDADDVHPRKPHQPVQTGDGDIPRGHENNTHWGPSVVLDAGRATANLPGSNVGENANRSGASMAHLLRLGFAICPGNHQGYFKNL